MNTYIFIGATRKNTPTLEVVVHADNPKEAIQKTDYYPYCIQDFEESRVEKGTSWVEWIEGVYQYYGLVEGESAYDAGNGPDGYRTIMVCIPGYVEQKDTPIHILPAS
jgi:hypothetical protein